MSKALKYTISLGGSKVGLSLQGQLYTHAGATSGSRITTGFAEIGGGCYTVSATVADDFEGLLAVYDGAATTPLAAGIADTIDANLVLMNGAVFTLETTATIAAAVDASASGRVARAVLSGVSTIVDNGDGTSSIAYKAADGLTTVVTVTCSNTVKGSRTASVEA